MSAEMTEKVYAEAAEKVADEHKEAVSKAKAAVAKAEADALKKLGS